MTYAITLLLLLLLLAALMAATTFGMQRLRRRLEAALQEERVVRRGTEERVNALIDGIARAQSEIRFQSRLLNAVGQGVVGTDLDGHVVYCNQAAANLLAWDPQEAVRSTIIELLPSAGPDADDRTVDRLRSGEPWSGEMIVRRRDGSLLPIMVTDSPIYDEHDRRIGMARIAVDLSPRKDAERGSRLLADAGAALASALDSEETLRNVVRMAVPAFADACIVDLLDDEGRPRRVDTANVVPAKEPIVHELRRRYPLSLEGASAAARAIRTAETVLISTVTDDDVERTAVDAEHARLRREFGARSAIHVPLIAVGRTIGALSFFMTVSSRIFDERDVPLAEELGRRAALAIDNARLYEAALLANQAKADFIAVMSHELRTPLTTIMGYTDLLLTGLPEPMSPKAHGYLERTRAAAWHLLGVIEQILIYTRVEAGTEVVQPQRIQINDVLTQAARLIEPVAGERGLDFRVDSTSADAAIETDVLKLRQILLNLLSNAVKFTDRGEVRLRARPDSECVTFEVIDTGIGIAPEHHERVFDAFWQIDQSATRPAGGTGLGLTVSRRLARMLGGDITVDSEPGWGATFRVTLPYEWRGRG